MLLFLIRAVNQFTASVIAIVAESAARPLSRMAGSAWNPSFSAADPVNLTPLALGEGLPPRFRAAPTISPRQLSRSTSGRRRQRKKLKPDLVVLELAAGKPRPLDGVLALVRVQSCERRVPAADAGAGAAATRTR